MKNMLKKIIVCAVIAAALVVLHAVKPVDDRTQSGTVAIADEPSTTPGDTTPGATTPGAGETPSGTPATSGTTLPDGITGIQMLYTREEIVVTSNAQVYYAQLKKPTDNAVKPADIIQAAKVTEGTYLIDISGFSASKDLYLGITNKLSADSNGFYPVMNCKVPGTYKKVQFNPNFAAEGDAAAGYGILKNVIVSNTDGTTVTYDNDSTNDKTRPITELKIEWKKGNNCAYSDISTLTPSVWESMKISGAILYLRLAAADGNTVTEGHRYSPENKIKLAITKSKELKVDVQKLSVPIANGMQFRKKGSEIWLTILPYNGKSKTEKALRDVTLAATPFDPYTESTSVKVKELSINEIFDTVNYIPAEDTAVSVEFEVRVAATSKKPASRISTFRIPFQYNGPVVEAKAAGTDVVFSSITNSPQDKVSGKYEYTVVDKADISANTIVLSQIKWYSVKTGSVLKSGANIKGTYTRKDGSRKTVILGDGGSVILVRRCGIKESKKNAAVLASKYTVVDPTTLSKDTPAPSGSGDQTPSGGGDQTPSGGGDQTPSGGGDQTPSGGGDQTPSGGGDQTPSGGGDQTPSGGSDQTPGGT